MKLHTAMLARCLALVALLCALGLQLEVTHSHADHEGVAECLACKSSAPAAVSLAPAPDIENPGAESPAIEGTIALPTSFFSYESRGPPHLS